MSSAALRCLSLVSTLVLFAMAVGACRERPQPQTASSPPPAPAPAPVPDAAAQKKARLLAEVVLRLRGADLATDPETKAMVDKALAANQGTAVFVEIVEAFAIQDRDADLLRVAAEHPAESFGALALRLVLANSGTDPVAKALQERDGAAIARALGNANDQRALPLLMPLIDDQSRDLALRQESVRAIGQFEAGAMELLARCKASTLAADLQTVATGVLANAPWDAVRAEVQQAMPAPATADGTLPPIQELATRHGDVARGEQVFGRVCLTCHQVAGKGVDYGPDLSVIGSKLGKDGLYLAILHPDAGVEFNYETTVIGLRDGNSAIGIVVSDTAEEVAIKSIGGVVNRYRAADVVRRSRQKTSSMPTGLQGGLREQELVDLVEYLVALRTK
ncbi:MAG: c-type cytochrome [Planctomycetes bacterium]|nr:c-type cytochrome [Planctomycetota bacterium]